MSGRVVMGSTFIHLPMSWQIRFEALTVFALIIAQWLTRCEEQLRYELSQDMLDACFLLLLNACLAFHVMYQKVGGIFKDCFVLVE